MAVAVTLTLTSSACGPSSSSPSSISDGSSSDAAAGISRIDAADRIPGPSIAGRDLEGRPVDIADWQGNVVVVNVWGSWCPPCRAETPDLNRVAEETAPDVQFLGIAVRESAATSLAFKRKQEVPYPSLSDSGGSLLRRFAEPLPAVAVPTTYVLDSKGRVAVRVLDQVSYATLRALIEDVQAEDGEGP